MRCDYQDKAGRAGLPTGKVYRTDTAEEIPFCFFFDTETGEYRHWAAAPDGCSVLVQNGRPVEARGFAPLRFVPDGGRLTP
jgi:hypothetical protein